MTEDSVRPSKGLLAEISRDLHPVRPAPLPSRLALRVAPFALIVSLTALSLIGMRRDAAAIGPVLMWGASIAQFGLGIVIVWIAARESTPARRLPRNIVWSAVAVTCLIAVGITLMTFMVSPTIVSHGHSPWRVGVRCSLGSTAAGSLLVILFGWLFRHSLAARPAFTGALYGAGAGISVNAGWRLACPISTPSHSFVGHGIAVILTALLGAAAAHLIAKRFRKQSGSVKEQS